MKTSIPTPLRSVIHGGRERYLIVIDALDESGDAGRIPLVEMLALMIDGEASATDNSAKHAADISGQRVVLSPENNFSRR